MMRKVIFRSLVGATAALALLGQGCVTRSITVRSDPPGAKTYLDGKYIGDTPVTTPFQHYGSRKIRLEEKGSRIRSEIVRIRAPWYQLFPLDLICELLVPYRFRDEREFSFDLQAPDKDRKTLLERATQERERLQEPAP